MVLLDGLDEVANDENRRRVSYWVERQISQYPENDFVITSRPHGYQAAPINGATVLQTRRFDDEQVLRFINGWYSAIERISTGADNVAVRMRAQEGADDLLRRLRSMPTLYELTANPLLLTMVANVHRFRGALPASRVDLYRDICEVMLWRRQEAKNIVLQFPGDSTEGALRRLAYEMMIRNVRDLSLAEASALLRPLLARFPGLVRVELFVESITSCGILIERERGLYSFAHQTFQEYLSAVYIRDKGIADALQHAVNDTWWRETILLYTARNNADHIVRACLESGTATALALAFDCSEQATELDPSLRRELDSLLDRAFSDESASEMRHLMARVFVTRKLRGTVKLSSGARICVHPVSKAMYRLFAADLADGAHARRPDDPSYDTDTDMDKPALGVRAEDALALVTWINALSGDPTYRLPTNDDIRDITAGKIGTLLPRHVWLQPKDGRPVLCVRGNARETNFLPKDDLSRRLRADIFESLGWHFQAALARTAAAAGCVDQNLRAVVIEHFSRSTDPERAFDKLLGLASLIASESSKTIAPFERPLGVMLRNASGDGYIGSKLPFIGKTFNTDPYEAINLNHDRVSAAIINYIAQSTERTGRRRRVRSDISHPLVMDFNDEYGMNLALRQIMGHAYSEAMSKAWIHACTGRSRDRRSLYLTAICTDVMRRAKIDHDLHFPLPEEMLRLVRAASDNLVRRAASNGWPRATLQHFLPAIEGIFLRHERLDASLARLVRVTAVLLSIESKLTNGFREEAAAFLQVAAAVTRLEDRLCSEERPDEAIILAVDR